MWKEYDLVLSKMLFLNLSFCIEVKKMINYYIMFIKIILYKWRCKLIGNYIIMKDEFYM